MDDLFHEMPGTLVSKRSSAVAKAKKRGEVYESAKAGGAIGAMAGGGLGTASGLGLIASGAAEPMIRQNPSKAGRALTRTFVPLNSGVRGAARWGVAGVGLGAAAGVYGKHKRNKQSSVVAKGWGSDAAVRGARTAQKAKLTAKKTKPVSDAAQDHYLRAWRKFTNLQERSNAGQKISPMRSRSFAPLERQLPGYGGRTGSNWEFNGNKRVRKAYQSWTFVPVKAAAKAKKASLPAGPKPRPKAPNAYVPPRTIRDPRKSVSVNQNKRPPSVWD